jgi:hypothetical protein
VTDIDYLVIDPEGTIIEQRGPLTMEDAQRILNGQLEAVQPPRDMALSILVNPDGKQLGLPPNWAITRVLRGTLRPTDFIVGVAIVAGAPDGDGELTSIRPDEVEQVRKKAAK